ncbi:MAG: HAD family phosphatase [Bacteroidota bacterium]
MSGIKHLIFDCDGVLIDSEYVAVNVMLKMLAPFGYTSSFQEYANQFTGMLDTEILKYLNEKEGLPFPPNFYQQIEAERDRVFEEELKPVQGMPELVKGISFPKSVVSNSHVAHVEMSLDICGIRPLFEGRIYSSEHVLKPKPHPDVYMHALQSLSLSADEVLVVEDSLTGVQSAKGAGCKVIGFAGASHISEGHTDKLLELGVEKAAKTPEELSDILATYLLL